MSKQSVWNGLRQRGFNSLVTAALMGNFEAESNNESMRLQGDFTADRSKSQEYTYGVDVGSYAYNSFIYDNKGYGLAQWTYWSRKSGLHNLAKSRNVSIGNEDMQLDYVVQELNNQYSSVLSSLNSATNLKDAVTIILRKYEQPQDQSEGVAVLRTSYAQEIYEEFASSTVPSTTTTESEEQDTAVDVLKRIEEKLDIIVERGQYYE